jgi:hypothetical integral membrane protein (TIGR02206 family)
MPEWLTTFAPFTAMHVAVVFVAVVVTVVLVRMRGPLGDSPAGRRLDRVLACVGIANWVLYQGYGLLRVLTDGTGKYTIEYAVPLQVCDIASLLAPLMWLITPARRWMSVIVYFWGLGLSSQAFVTPIVRSGPATFEFWFFFIAHWMIVGGALYETFGRGFRPTWRDFRFIVIVSLSYYAVIFPFNILTGFNIGFLGEPDAADPKTIADSLGPWPLRTLWIAIIGHAMMVLVMLPWVFVRREHALKDEAA